MWLGHTCRLACTISSIHIEYISLIPTAGQCVCSTFVRFIICFLAHLTQPFKMKPKQESEHLLQTLHVKSVGKRTTQKIMGWKWHQYSWWWNLIFNWMTITMNVCVCLCVCADVPFSTIFYIGFTVTEHNRTHLINLLFCFSVVVDIPVAWNRCHFMLNDSIPWPL